MDSVVLWMDEENREERVERRTIRDKSNIFEMSDKSFVENFRLSKIAFNYVLNAIREELSTPMRSTAVPDILKLAVTLKFLGQGEYQHQIGHDYSIGMLQQTTSSSIAVVCSAIEKVLCPRHINFKMSEPKRREAKQYSFKEDDSLSHKLFEVFLASEAFKRPLAKSGCAHINSTIHNFKLFFFGVHIFR